MISKTVMLNPSLFIDRHIGHPIERRVAIEKLGQKTDELKFLEFYIPESFETAVF